FVIQRSTEPAPYEMAQMNLPPVFKFMNDMTNDSTTAVCRYCSLEMKCAMSTVRTRERARDRTFERFGAFLAKRRDDAGCLCFANIAQILATSKPSPAERASGRSQERYGCFKYLRLVNGDHS